MRSIARSYVFIALLWLIGGMIQGFWMGATNALQYRDLHVAMLLPGFVTLALYGAIYRLWPELETAPLARLQFRIAIVGSLLVVAGALQLALTGGVLIVATGSGIAIGGAALLFYLFASGALSEAK